MAFLLSRLLQQDRDQQMARYKMASAKLQLLITSQQSNQDCYIVCTYFGDGQQWRAHYFDRAKTLTDLNTLLHRWFKNWLYHCTLIIYRTSFNPSLVDISTPLELLEKYKYPRLTWSHLNLRWYTGGDFGPSPTQAFGLGKIIRQVRKTYEQALTKQNDPVALNNWANQLNLDLDLVLQPNCLGCNQIDEAYLGQVIYARLVRRFN